MQTKAYIKKVGNLLLVKEIGKGCYGRVYEAHNEKGEKFAVKTMKCSDLNPKLQAYLEKEVDAVQKLKHPHIMKLKDLLKTDSNYYLVFEFCDQGDLDGYRKLNGGCLNEFKIQYFVRQISDAIYEINKKGFIHRDIKLPNILLSTGVNALPDAKIGDFGFAKLLKTTDNGDVEMSMISINSSYVGTPLNMSPEILNKKPYNYVSDIWSLGTITYQLLTGSYPFCSLSRDQLLLVVNKGEYKIKKTISPSPFIIDFIAKCLQYNESKRARISKLINHPFLTCTELQLNDKGLKEELNSKMKIDGDSYILSAHEQIDYLKKDALLEFEKLEEEKEIPVVIAGNDVYI